MITSLRLVNFKNFADETLRLGPFTVIVGANASGKSNIRDAFRFLHGIGRGYTLPEIIGGRRDAGWRQIRGAANEVMRFGQQHFSIELRFELEAAESKDINYFIAIRQDGHLGGKFRVVGESLAINRSELYTSDTYINLNIGAQENPEILPIRLPGEFEIILAPEQPALHQVTEHVVELQEPMGWGHQEPSPEEIVHFTAKAIEELRRVRFLELMPESMREPSLPGAAKLGDSGENLPAALEEICEDARRKEVLTSWLDELTPMDVVDFEFPRDPTGRVHLQLVERNGRRVSAYSASDGTLRFLGLLAALLGDVETPLYFFEEIDKGIHPARLSLLIELIERQTAKGGVQVVATTHSPGLLDLVNDTTFDNTSVVYRGEESADAIIRPVTDLPRVKKLRKSQGLGRLHASGWMENMLAFEEADNADPVNVR